MSNSIDSLQPIQVHINGEPRECSPQTSLPNLLEQLGMNPRLVAVSVLGWH
jgi:sulfur carrier protein